MQNLILQLHLIVGYADDHTLLKTNRNKSDHVTAVSQLMMIWKQTFLLLISLKCDLLPSQHPPLTINNAETSSIKDLGFKFDSLLTWEPQITDILRCDRQKLITAVP